MRKSILGLGVLAVSVLTLASCGEEGYSVRREDAKEISKEDVQKSLISYDEKEALKIFSDNNVVSVKDTYYYYDYKGNHSYTYEFALDIETGSVSLKYDTTFENHKTSYSIFGFLDNDKYLYCMDLHVENYPIYTTELKEVPGIGYVESPSVDRTISGDAKVRGEITIVDNQPSISSMCVLGHVGTIPFSKDYLSLDNTKTYATEDESYYWTELNMDDPVKRHEIGVSENKLLRYQLIDSASFKLETKAFYFDKNQLDSKKDISNYVDCGFTLDSVSLYSEPRFRSGLNIESLIEEYIA